MSGIGKSNEIALKIQQVFLEIRKGFSLGDVVREFVEVAEPVFPVLPVGKACRRHRLSLSEGGGRARRCS